MRGSTVYSIPEPLSLAKMNHVGVVKGLNVYKSLFLESFAMYNCMPPVWSCPQLSDDIFLSFAVFLPPSTNDIFHYSPNFSSWAGFPSSIL